MLGSSSTIRMERRSILAVRVGSVIWRTDQGSVVAGFGGRQRHALLPVVMANHLITSRGLGSVHGAVRGVEELGGAMTVGGIGRNAKRERRHDRLRALEERDGMKSLADLLGALNGGLKGRLRQDDDKFLAAIAAGDITRADVL